MEESTLEQKIKKQLEFIRQQINKFSRSFQTKNFKSQNFRPYLEALNRVFDLNNSYGEDYYEFIQKKNLQFVLANNRLLMKDISAKFKGLYMTVQNDKSLQNTKQSQSNGICKLCNLHIESQSIENAKSDVEDNGINQLKRMLKRIQKQSNQALFSPDQDKHFFQQLNKVLTNKQEVLSITDNHLQKYLEDIMKNLKQIKYLQDLKDTTFQLPQSINWETKIKNEINYVLLNSFKGKVPVWIQKTFDYFIKLNDKMMRQFRQSIACQTDPYIQDQVLDLRKVIDKHNEEQKVNRAINQDYIKLIKEKDQKINNMEIENNILKQSLFSKQISFNKTIASNSKELRSLRNSSLTNQKQSTLDNISSKKSKFKSVISSSVQGNQLTKKLTEDMQQIGESKHSSVYGQENRNGYSIIQHIDSSNYLGKVKRRNHKKLTDIDYFRKTRSNQRNKSFLPTISQPFKDTLQLPQNKINLKKTSILSAYSQKITKQDQKETIIQRLQIPSFQNRMDHSKSIIQEQQGNQRDITESEINLIQNLSESERIVRVQKYKQTVSDVQNQLESKIHNLEALKKRKKNSLLSLNLKWNPQHNHTSTQLSQNRNQQHSNTMLSVQRNLPENVNFMTQTQYNHGLSIKNGKSQQNFNKLINANSQHERQLLSKKANSKSIEVQTEETKLQILKQLQNNANFSQISDEHLQKLLSKLLFNPQNNKTQKSKSKKNKKDSDQKENTEKSRIRFSQDDVISENKENTLPQDSRHRYPAKSMFAQNSKNPMRDNSSETKTKKHTTRFEQSNQSTSQPQLKSLQTCLFTRKDFTLFLSQENSFKYESNLIQKYHKSPFTQLTEQQVKSLTSLYNILQLVKHHSLQQYNHILSFIKYPYQTVVNNFSILNIVKEMSLETWLWYMTRIKYYHQKCLEKNDDGKMICCHVQKFAEKIENILIQAASCSMMDEQNAEMSHTQSIVSSSPKKKSISPKKVQLIK